jgi:hypothetical protein
VNEKKGMSSGVSKVKICVSLKLIGTLISGLDSIRHLINRKSGPTICYSTPSAVTWRENSISAESCVSEIIEMQFLSPHSSFRIWPVSPFGVFLPGAAIWYVMVLPQPSVKPSKVNLPCKSE